MMQTTIMARMASAIALSTITPCVLIGASLLPADATVGSNLQTRATVTLSEVAPQGGIEITLTSDDPAQLQFSTTPDGAGAGSITILTKVGFRESPEFWVHGLASDGAVTYTATAPGFSAGTGTVSLSPSAIVITGPYRGAKFPTTTRAQASRIAVYSVRVDSSRKYVEQQVVAGGLSTEVEITSSNPEVGTVTNSKLTIAGGAASAVTDFQPLAPGETSLAVTVPPGFSAPAEMAAVVAVVSTPGIGLTGGVAIGKNLQLGAVVGLGEAAHEGGVSVTLTSNDPSRLLLSASPTDVGSKTISIKIPAGGVNSSFYLQALADSGTASYDAVAPGYVSRTASVMLAPSGVVLMPRPYGPPDEAEVLRKEGGAGTSGFVSSLSDGHTMALVAWMVQLDPATLRGADITVQPLRAGLSVTVDMKISNTAVGKVSSPVTITGGSDHAVTEFKPLRTGTTVISAITPPGFTTSSNSTTVNAIVRE
jgi:hypothetical protein